MTVASCLLTWPIHSSGLVLLSNTTHTDSVLEDFNSVVLGFFPTDQSLVTHISIRLSCYEETVVDCYPLFQSIHYNNCNYMSTCVQAMGSDGWSSKLI